MTKGMWIATVLFAVLLVAFARLHYYSPVQTSDRHLLRVGLYFFMAMSYSRLMMDMYFHRQDH